jgi:DNA-directed RNA polymerase specialized sigma24 family protein
VTAATTASPVPTIIVLTPEQIMDLVRQGVEQALAIRPTQQELPTDEGLQLLSYSEAAEMCSCSPSTLRRRVRSGDLEAVTCLGRPKFRQSDIEQLIQHGSRSPVKADTGA